MPMFRSHLIRVGAFGQIGRFVAGDGTLYPRAARVVLRTHRGLEIGEVLAKEKGIEQGGWVRVASKRGFVVCKAYVTKRIRPLTVDGKPTHVIGVPLHWGFTGQARKGYGANTLTPSVGDANTQTPEFKAFLVNLEKTTAPAA